VVSAGCINSREIKHGVRTGLEATFVQSLVFNFRLPPRCELNLRSSGMLRSLDC
jgi:hypothetical protein